MTESVVQRVRQYLLDGDDEDLKRLLAISEVMADTSRTAVRRAGIQAGWNVVECGCGPVGALVVLADLVGPSGRVVGVEASPSTVERARSVAEELGLDNVKIVAGDVNDVDVAAVGGPFDLAFSRLFLMHQADAARTLRRMADLVRPCGSVIALEPLRNPAPQSFPPVDALGDYWNLLCDMIEGFGVPAHTVERLPSTARAAGLEVVGVNGAFTTGTPEKMMAIHVATLSAARDRATAAGLVAEGAIDEVIDALRAASTDRLEWVTSPFFLELTMRRPVHP